MNRRATLGSKHNFFRKTGMSKRSLKLYITTIILVIPLWGNPETVQAQYFWNTDFEYGVYKSQPRKWSIEGEGEKYTAYLDSEESKSGNKSLFMSLTNAETYTFLSIPGELVTGKTISVHGYIKAQISDSIEVRLLLFNPAEGNVLVSADQKLVENKWEPASLKASLKENLDSNNVLIAVLASGSGSFWLDAIQVNIGGKNFGDDAPDFREPTKHEIARLNEKALPFEMKPDKKETQNFKGLSDLVGNARLVALGENSHGSSSIYELKLRMIKYLVEQEGFSIFALEMPTIEADYINNYVQYGRGNIDQVLTKLTYPSWQTREMIDIIQWIKAYNDQHENDIAFRGFDMQNGWSALGAVKDFAASYDSVLLAESEAVIELYERSLKNGQLEEPLLKKSRDIVRYLSKNRFSESPLGQVETIRHYMDVFGQSLALRFGLDHAKSRDEYMAENIRWILENATDRSRIIISADNTHITEAGGKTGSFLKRWYGEDYVSFGFTYKKGTYSAYGSEPFYEVHPPYVGTYEYFFSKGQHKNFILDLREPLNIPILNQRSGFRSIGSRPQEVTQFYEMDLKKHFDAVVFLDTSRHTSYLKQ